MKIPPRKRKTSQSSFRKIARELGIRFVVTGGHHGKLKRSRP